MKQQEGFAFVTYRTEEAAVQAMNSFNNVMIRGILLVTTLSYRNPKPQMNPFALGMQQQQQGFPSQAHYPQHHNNMSHMGISPKSIGSSNQSIGSFSVGSGSTSSSYYNQSTVGPSHSPAQYLQTPFNMNLNQSGPIAQSQYVVQTPSSLLSNQPHSTTFGIQQSPWSDSSSNIIPNSSLTSSPSDVSSLPSHIFRAAPSNYPSISQTSSGEFSSSGPPNYSALPSSSTLDSNFL